MCGRVRTCVMCTGLCFCHDVVCVSRLQVTLINAVCFLGVAFNGACVLRSSTQMLTIINVASGRMCASVCLRAIISIQGCLSDAQCIFDCEPSACVPFSPLGL
jgi:hypothetical protein